MEIESNQYYVTPLGLKLLEEKEKALESEWLESQKELGEMARGDPGDGIDDPLFIQSNMIVTTKGESLRQIRNLISKVQKIQKPNQNEVVQVGHFVFLRLDYVDGESEKFTALLVGMPEALLFPKNILGETEAISNQSPLGLAISGKRQGEKFSYVAGSGTISGEIFDIKICEDVFLI